VLLSVNSINAPDELGEPGYILIRYGSACPTLDPRILLWFDHSAKYQATASSHALR